MSGFSRLLFGSKSFKVWREVWNSFESLKKSKSIVIVYFGK